MREIKLGFKEWLNEVANQPAGEPGYWFKELIGRLFKLVPALNHATAEKDPAGKLSRSYQGRLSLLQTRHSIPLNSSNEDQRTQAEFQAYSSLLDFQEQIAKDIQQNNNQGEEAAALLDWWNVIELTLNQKFGHHGTRPQVSQSPMRIPAQPVIDQGAGKNDSWFGRLINRKTA